MFHLAYYDKYLLHFLLSYKPTCKSDVYYKMEKKTLVSVVLLCSYNRLCQMV